MRLDIVTLFPEMIETLGRFGVTGKAVEAGKVALNCWNPRDYATDNHRTVDDRPFGGGPGMVMKIEPLRAAISDARKAAPQGAPVVCLSPQGETFDQAMAQELAGLAGVILVAGRYEGIDERLIELEVDREISVGDFVLSGGEIPAMAVIDAIARLIPGVLGDEDSAKEDSFVNGLLDCPHYTRPASYAGKDVPAVLVEGNHEKIRRWRLKQALGRTWERRPELLEHLELTDEQRALLEEFKLEAFKNGQRD